MVQETMKISTTRDIQERSTRIEAGNEQQYQYCPGCSLLHLCMLRLKGSLIAAGVHAGEGIRDATFTGGTQISRHLSVGHHHEVAEKTTHTGGS